jgi:hypothetical protein
MQELLMMLLLAPTPRLLPLLWPRLMFAEGTGIRPIAPQAAWAAALFITFVAAALRCLFAALSDSDAILTSSRRASSVIG